MNKTIEIIEPSKKIFNLYSYFEKEIKKALPQSKVKLIGSFSVPMCGKKEIDILIEIHNVVKAQEILEKIGFSKGPIVKGEGFLRQDKDGIICELHILQPDDKKIRQVYDKITNILKENKELRERFENLKRSLNGKTEEEYKLAKSKFILENILRK